MAKVPQSKLPASEQAKQANDNVLLDLNNPQFQKDLFGLPKADLLHARTTLEKLRQMTWQQVYGDRGLKWEKISSVKPPKGVDAIYSIRLSEGRRATAFREGEYMRFLTVPPDHDATYGKK